VGFWRLTIPEQHYLAVTMLDAEVNNGGHGQYFLNSSGSEWREALAGLEVIERLNVPPFFGKHSANSVQRARRQIGQSE
jgi:hypothetical protein